jgi:predicted peptidase
MALDDAGLEKHDPASPWPWLEFSVASGSADLAIVYLHGSGERGDDRSLVTRYGLPALISQESLHMNACLLCPQLAADGVWDADRLCQFIELVQLRFSRVMLMGYSWGANGVCNLLAKYGGIVPLAIAIAGQSPATVQADLMGCNLLVIQGEEDTWANTASFVNQARLAGGQVRSVVLAGKGHFISEEVCELLELRQALAQQGIIFSAVAKNAAQQM